MIASPLAPAALLVAAVALAIPSSAVAQSLTGTFGDKSGKVQEIKIESDVMEIEQKASRAIFSGNVDAIRGAVHLRSNKLTADYREVTNGDTTRTEIVKLDARGNVVVTSKDQKAVSEWAVMMVQDGLVTMGGSVVLTQGKTVIEGERLVMDLNTGKSKLTGGKSGKGRVKGVFVPSRD